MTYEAQARRPADRREQKAQAVRFSAPARAPQSFLERVLGVGNLLPRQWRRRVVIHGKRFWLPG